MRPIVPSLILCIVVLWIGNIEAKKIKIKLPQIIMVSPTTTTSRPTTKKATVIKVAKVKTVTSIRSSTTPAPPLNTSKGNGTPGSPCFNFTDSLPWTPTAFNETDRTFACTESEQLCGTYLSLSAISLLFSSEAECHQKGATAFNNTYLDWKPRLNITVLPAPSTTGNGTLASLLSMLMGKSSASYQLHPTVENTVQIV